MLLIWAVLGRNPKVQSDSGSKIAVVYAEGEIVDGEGSSSNVGGERYAREIRKFRVDPSVKAIVLRVNSPGGSGFASEEIYRELKAAEETKPVIVSMGGYAASGGYYISSAVQTYICRADNDHRQHRGIRTDR